MSIEELVAQYCRAWDEAEAPLRYKLLKDVFEDDGIYTDPTVHLTGLGRLVEHIGQVATRYPGSRIVRTSTVDVHHDRLRFGWRKQLAGGDLLPDSVDFAMLSPRGKLQLVVGFFGPMKAIG